MDGGGFRVAPDALIQLAAELERLGEAIGREAAGFSASAQPPAGTFVLLAAAAAAHRAYRETAHEAFHGLKVLQAAVGTEVPAALRSSAANYLTTDDESAASFR
jgi:hypothetical protein